LDEVVPASATQNISAQSTPTKRSKRTIDEHDVHSDVAAPSSSSATDLGNLGFASSPSPLLAATRSLPTSPAVSPMEVVGSPAARITIDTDGRVNTHREKTMSDDDDDDDEEGDEDDTRHQEDDRDDGQEPKDKMQADRTSGGARSDSGIQLHLSLMISDQQGAYIVHFVNLFPLFHSFTDSLSVPKMTRQDSGTRTARLWMSTRNLDHDRSGGIFWHL
jgi:hypothetical protein